MVGPYIAVVALQVVPIVMGDIMLRMTYVSIVIALVAFFAHALWQFSIVKEGQKKLPAGYGVNTGIFMLLFYSYIAYTSFANIVVLLYSYASIPDFIQEAFADFRAGKIVGIPYVTLFSWICVIYFAYLPAKMLAAIRNQEKVYLSDYIGIFFLFLFFPIGVWFIQPRLNEIFGRETAIDPNTPLDHNLN